MFDRDKPEPLTTPDELAAYLRETADLALKNISSTAPEVLHHAAMLRAAADALAAQAAPAAQPVAWFVDANEGTPYARHGVRHWVNVQPGDSMWSDKWTRYALAASPQADTQPSEQKK